MTSLSTRASSIGFKQVRRNVMVEPRAIAEHARKPDTRGRLVAALGKIDNDDCDASRLERFSRNPNLLDNATVAHAAAELIAPRTALEIGVRRGYTSCAIASAAPKIDLHMMDSWRPIYAERPNPGPVLVREQLAAVGHSGNATFHHGNSHELMPILLVAHPQLQFDILVVDGDHTELGAEQDLRDTFPRVAHGGVLIFDDLIHPSHRYLLDVWNRWKIALASDFSFSEYLEDGLGVGWAVRN